MNNSEKIVIYQVFPRLFGNDNPTNEINGSIEKNGCGKFSAFSNIALNEIQKMGFTHIWYTGVIEHATKTDYSAYGISKDNPTVVKGNAGSPYAIKDYYDVDPDLADDVKQRMNEFEELVERTHAANLKMIIDFVPNHVARQYHSDAKPAGIKDLGENDNIHTSFDANNNFYYIPGQAFAPDFDLHKYKEFPAKATGNDKFDAHPGINDWYETVKLNYGIDYLSGGHKHFNPIPNTWHKMLDILLFWSSKNIDGFRCDMAEMVPVEFWNWVIPQVKEKYPEIVFIAEVYNPLEYRNYLWNGKFDYLYDKVGLYDTLRAVIRGEKPASAITGCWQSIEGIQHQMLNFLENHDEQRIASVFFAEDPLKYIPAMVVAATMNTNPVMIYCGQELGEPGIDQEGFSGLDGRTTIFDYWSVDSIRKWRNKGKYDGKELSKGQKDLREFYVKLLNLCNSEKAIREGLFYDLMYLNYGNSKFNSDKQYVYLRKADNEILLIVVNFEDKDVETSINIPASVFDFLQISPKKIGTGIDLLTKEKSGSLLKPDNLFRTALKANGVRIFKFL
ncbi:MAG: alpha-amylase [Dysgonamonadaceae bacterium]|jgi:glycosidase|nr:alpha-amylase [Dysgonamonadaceae bacterium]